MFEDVDDIVIPGFSGAELRAEDFPVVLPDPQPKPPSTPNVTVHQFIYRSQRNPGASPLGVGRRAAEMATATSEWRTISPPDVKLIFRDDHSFDYSLPAPILPSDTSIVREKGWGEPPTFDEIFVGVDLDEFVGTTFSDLGPFAPSNSQPEIQAASQYDPYAELDISWMSSTPYAPPVPRDYAPRGTAEGVFLDPQAIPGFADEIDPMDVDTEPHIETYPKPPPGPRSERDYPSGSPSDADLYGSALRHLSPPQGSDHPGSHQGNDNHERQLTRMFDTSTLLHVIPEPHFYPAPSANPSIARRSRVPPFSKSIPVPLYPNTDTSIEIYLQTSYNRGSWIIPIRGMLPWDGCTKARILQPNPSADAYPPKQSYEGYTDLIWTHASLVSFWSFLCQINRVETMGSMGISFHADTSFSDDGPAYNNFSEYEPTPPEALFFDTEPSEPQVTLLLVDHIKVYCDVEFAMNVRTVLASWQYLWDENNAAEDAFDFDLSGSQASDIELYGKESQQFQVRKIQLLQGARIPFLDHRNDGLFVC